jgi:GNAT superfamily N-acetyltransferase
MKRWLYYTLEDFKCDTEIAKHVLIYYKDGKPVAAFIILKGVLGNSYNCGVYVLPEYRKRGIDKALIKRARQKGFDVFPWMGSNDAATFYKKVFGNENIPSANITSNYE